MKYRMLLFLKHAARAASVLFGLSGTVMAEAHTEKFSLMQSDGERTEFEFADSALDFTTVAPVNFLWNLSTAPVPELVPSAMFSDLQEQMIGYDPLNRDRYEVRVYTGTIFPDRIAVAADYGRLFARVWSNLNFGVMAHNRNFGEVLAGDESSGLMIVNRITVIRRGNEILIVRSKFHADHFETYAKAMAEMIGSITFAVPASADPVATQFTAVSQDVANGMPAIQYDIPGNWVRFDAGTVSDSHGDFQIWIDSADPNRNGGVMFATAPPQSPVPPGETITPQPQDLANLAGSFANVLLQNLLPDQEFRLEPLKMNSFDNLKDLTAFNALYVFKVQIADNLAEISSLITMGPDGALLATTTIAPAPVDLYLTGTGMHVNFVQGQALDGATAYWTARKEESLQ